MHAPASPASRERRSVPARAAALALAAVLLGGCAAGEDSGDAGERDRGKAAGEVRLPPVHAGFDYQIGGPYSPPEGVRVVSRDRKAEPAAGHYSVCYVNAFQAQPNALEWWDEHHPRLLLRDDEGEPVMDTDWDEAIFDTSSAGRRAELARIVGRWIDGCADKGFQAVELDNLDSYERSDDRLDHADNVAFAKLLTRRAHDSGMAAGQKNAADMVGRRKAMGFDFAVTEQCGQYKECEQYAKAYDDRVLDVEYDAKGMANACRAWGDRLSVVRRDLDVKPRGEKGYVFAHC
ncbi:endo alpha-1,4 polygalactosaminidase [Streptomyces albus]|uniref:endo alpha-1,4 polygalactosaminidase n=1 Tax=Streptomyces albus TaxID=1888 RepID=UPI0037881A58